MDSTTIQRTRVSRDIRDFTKNQVLSKDLTKFVTYSEDQIDIVLYNMFNKNNGFYVDIGCNDPNLISNTRFLYDMGWQGVSVDMIAQNTVNHVIERPGDYVFNYAVSDKDFDYVEATVPISVTGARQNSGDRIREDNMGGGSSTKHDVYLGNTSARVKVPTMKLDSLLGFIGKKLPHIDFLIIDVEGAETEVFNGFNIDNYKPKVIVVESNVVSKTYNEFDVGELISSKGYSKVYDTLESPYSWSSNSFFVRHEYMDKLNLKNIDNFYSDTRFISFYYIFHRAESVLKGKISEVFFARENKENKFSFDSNIEFDVSRKYMFLNYKEGRDHIEFNGNINNLVSCKKVSLLLDEISKIEESSLLKCVAAGGQEISFVFYNFLGSISYIHNGEEFIAEAIHEKDIETHNIDLFYYF